MKKQPPKTSTLSQTHSCAPPWKNLLTCTTISGLLLLQGLPLQAEPANPAGDSATPEKPAHPAGDGTTPKPANPADDSATAKPANPAGDGATPKPANPADDSATAKPANPAGDSATTKPANPAGESTTSKPANPAGDSGTPKPANPAGDSATTKPANPAGDGGTPEKKPANAASIDLGAAQYEAHAVGKGLFSLFGAAGHFRLIVSGTLEGDKAVVKVSASEGKKNALGDKQVGGDREKPKNTPATAQEVITMERRDGMLTLVSVERKGPRGNESLIMESSPDIGLGPTVALKKGKEFLSGQLNPGTPVVPFQALPLWFAAEDRKDVLMAMNAGIYVVLDTQVIRCHLHVEGGKSHRQTFQLLQDDGGKNALELKFTYQDGKSTDDKIWPEVITLDVGGSAGVRFEKEEK